MATLYDKLGGAAAVNLAVDLFYEKVLADERVNFFFADIDMASQRKHQKDFMTYAFGGTEQYTGQSMREAHKRLVNEMGMTEVHFNAIAENLVSTLHELSVPQNLIDEVVAIVGAPSHRDDVLNR